MPVYATLNYSGEILSSGTMTEKLEVNITEINDGTINVGLSNGFLLVASTNSYDIDFERNPSFLTPPIPQMLGGGTPGYIVYDHSGVGTGHQDLTGVCYHQQSQLSGQEFHHIQPSSHQEHRLK